jgi:hypothetical protein
MRINPFPFSAAFRHASALISRPGQFKLHFGGVGLTFEIRASSTREPVCCRVSTDPVGVDRHDDKAFFRTPHNRSQSVIWQPNLLAYDLIFLPGKRGAGQQKCG